MKEITFKETDPDELSELVVAKAIPIIQLAVSEATEQIMAKYSELIQAETKARNNQTTDLVNHYTRQEVSQRYRCSLTTVDNYANSGKITRIRAGRRILFLKDEVDNLLKPVEG